MCIRDSPISERLAFPAEGTSDTSSTNSKAAVSIPQADNWCLEEDRMIVKSHDFDLPPPNKLAKEYIAAAKTRPLGFNKKISTEMLSARYEQLQLEFAERYRMLRTDVELETVRGEAWRPPPEVENESGPSLVVTVPSATQRSEVCFQVDKQAALKQSSLLRQMDKQGEETVLRPPPTQEHPDHCFLCPDTFERFAKFLDNPDIEVPGAPKPAGTTDKKEKAGDLQLLEQLERQYEAHKEAIESEKQRERARLLQGLESAFQNDMSSLRHSHKRQVALEDEKLKMKYCQTDQNIDRFYQRERKMLRSMLSKTKQAELSSKHMAEQAQLLRYMFEGSFLPRLTALACFLKAPGFQSLCLAQAAMSIERVCTLPQWRTDLIPTSVFEKLVSSLTDLQVVNLDSIRDCTLPKATISTDLIVREKIAEERLRRLNGARLRRAAIAPDLAFPHLVRRELEARRTAYSVVTLDERHCTPNVMIGEDRLRIATTQPRQYCTGHASKYFSITGDGMWYWEVSIDALTKDGSSFAVGLDAPREKAAFEQEPVPLPGLTAAAGGNPCGYVWQSDGILHLNGVTVSTERTYQQACAPQPSLSLDRGTWLEWPSTWTTAWLGFT
eukprot:TRINITY_DN10795_c0_g1_i2.p1 TRINITY_DN10795_c0_g1~~TRINITY_DN10795_c0_g1_i2.p1  ORF type:complete len:612 (+),score=182.29 TRINITY_DN10795_c0_g1_i2:139-1974(+)